MRRLCHDGHFIDHANYASLFAMEPNAGLGEAVGGQFPRKQTWSEISCEGQNHSFVPNKNVSQALYFMLQATKMDFEKLLAL